MRRLTVLAIFVAATSFAADLKHEVWHKPVREYEQRDSVLVPVVDYALIQKIKVGMTFEEVKQVVGVAPVDNSIHPDYAILETKVGDDYYEVAFLHKKRRVVEAISYRKSPWKTKSNNRAGAFFIGADWGMGCTRSHAEAGRTA